MKMVKEVGSPDNAKDYVINLQKSGERVMGFFSKLWKKTKNDKFELIPTDYLDDKSSADLNLKDIQTVAEYKTYFDDKSLKIASKSWITDFYSCEKVDHSNFAREKLIDIFVNQNIYVEKDFKYREGNPTSFSNKIDLLKE